jgi:hypothetical protein
MPEDIHPTLWTRIEHLIVSGRFAVTREAYDELSHLGGSIGECLQRQAAAILMEIGEEGWNWQAYIQHNVRMQHAHEPFISEYNGGRKTTVCLTDISTIALAKTLRLPVISMECTAGPGAQRRKHIPDICQLERVEHMTFNDLLHREGIVV